MGDFPKSDHKYNTKSAHPSNVILLTHIDFNHDQACMAYEFLLHLQTDFPIVNINGVPFNVHVGK